MGGRVDVIDALVIQRFVQGLKRFAGPALMCLGDGAAALRPYDRGRDKPWAPRIFRLSNTRTMNHVWRFLILLALCSKAFATDIPGLDARTRSLIMSLHADTAMDNISVGDLDGDGVADMAYVVISNDGEHLFVGVLRGRPDGSFVPWTHSQRLEHLQRSREVTIRGKTLEISLFRNGLSWGSWSTEKYSWRDDRLVRVGSEFFLQSPFRDDESGPISTQRISTNYLTGAVIRTDTIGKKRTTSSSKSERRELEPLSMFDGDE